MQFKTVHFTFSPVRMLSVVACCKKWTSLSHSSSSPRAAAAAAASLASYRFSSTSFSALSKLMTFPSPSLSPSILPFDLFVPFLRSWSEWHSSGESLEHTHDLLILSLTEMSLINRSEINQLNKLM